VCARAHVYACLPAAASCGHSYLSCLTIAPMPPLWIDTAALVIVLP